MTASPPIMIGSPTRDEIMPRPTTEGRHVRLGMRVYPGGAGQWYAMVRDPGAYTGRHRTREAN